MPVLRAETPSALLAGQAIDPRAFRDALGHYASGIAVITGRGDAGEPVGFICQSFYSVSLEPPLVSFSVRRASNSWPKIRPSGHFAVNVLHWEQLELSNGFARSTGDRWAGIDWSENAEGTPVIDGTPLTLECRLHAEHAAGDHTMALGEVLRLSQGMGESVASPLICYRGRYHQIAP